MKTGRAVLGMVPKIDFENASDDDFHHVAHLACHAAAVSASHCHTRVIWPSHGWQVEAAFREAGCDDEEKSASLVSAWQPGRPILVGVFDIDLPDDGPAPVRTYVN